MNKVQNFENIIIRNILVAYKWKHTTETSYRVHILFDDIYMNKTNERAIEDCVLAKISENDDKPDDDNDMNVNYQKYF